MVMVVLAQWQDSKSVPELVVEYVNGATIVVLVLPCVAWPGVYEQDLDFLAWGRDPHLCLQLNTDKKGGEGRGGQLHKRAISK
jgi:hypothetical protein